MVTIAALCCFAFLAGFVDAMVGGGGLIQLPAIFVLFPHLSLIQTLATNKTANFLGTSVAAYKYMRKVPIDWTQLMPVVGGAFLGSLFGAYMVSYIGKEQFMPVIITVLLSVLIYTVVNKNAGLHHNGKQHTKLTSVLIGVCMGIAIGFYDGLIGPGTGSFFVFAFIILFGFNFLHASANAKIVNWFTNVAALILFFSKAAVVWEIAIPASIANMAGSYLGSHLALKKGSAFIRVFFIIIVLLLMLRMIYEYL